MKITFFILIFVISLLFSTNITFGQSSDEDPLFLEIDDLFYWQNLQTDETISPLGTFVSIFVGSLGPILIVLFIVIYAIKKRMKKSGIET